MKHRTRTAHGVSVVNGDGNVIGVDIGATAVRAAVLRQRTVGGRTTVTAQGLGSVPLPDGTVVAGAVRNGPAVTAALKVLWSESKIRSRKVVLGATSQQVTVRDFTVPDLPPDQLRKTLPFQAQEVIALPIEQALLHFSPLGPPDTRSNTVTGLLTGIPRDPIVAAVAAVERARLRVARVDLAPFGLLRAIGTPGPSIEALADIGAHLTTIVIHVNGIARVVRVVPSGGQLWTEHLSDQSDIPFDEAEATKRTIGLTGTNLATKLLREAIRPLVNEIRGSINFFSTQYRVTVEQLRLTGGSAPLPGLAEHLAEQLSVPTVIAAPLQHLTDSAASVAAAAHAGHGSAVAVGLAMGRAA